MVASLENHFIPDAGNIFANSNAIFRGTNYRITILSDRLIRLEYQEDGNFSDALTTMVKNRNFSMPTFKVEQDEKYIVITTKYFMLQYLKEKPFWGPKFAPDSNLRVTLLNTDKVWYYGQVEARNFKGGAVSLDDYKGNINLDKGLYSTDGFVLLDDSKNFEVTDDGFLQPPHPKKNDLYLFMYKRDFGLCLKDYYTLTGYPPLIPRYALGVWWNREKIYSYNDIQMLAKTFNRYQIPLSVVLLSEFWHIKDKNDYNLYRTGFTFNKELFPNPVEMINYMHSIGIHIGLNIDPGEGIRKEEEYYTNMASDLNVLDNVTIPYNAMNKDFMASYIKYLINPMLNQNIDVYWLDYKKDLDNIQLLSYYYNKDFVKIKNYRPLVLTRSPLVAPHQAGILYSGETYVSWDTLKYLPFYNGMASNKGITWWSHDVGGYKGGVEESELYLRYVEFSCFNPIFRFSAKRGNYYKREPWLWDVKTYTIAREYTTLRQRLIPYIYTEAYEYHKNGRPLIQPIYYGYTEVYDEPIYRNEYFFGKMLFVAPITKPKDITMNRSVERLFLPTGVWYDFKNGKKYIGNKKYVMFYKEEEYPVFAKSGSIIPLAVLDKNINDTNSPRNMELYVFPGNSGIYRLYEDDGITKLYEDGYYIITVFDFQYSPNSYTFSIAPLDGKVGIIPPLRDYKIRFKNTKQCDNVTIYVNGLPSSLEYKSYQEENDFIIDIKDVDTSKKVNIVCSGNNLEINAVRIVNDDINSIINDLNITTALKEKIASIIFSNMDISKKRIEIKKLKTLDKNFKKMFLKLLEYIAEI